MEILKFNQSSWHFLFFGLIGCIISGSLVPLFSIVYSQIFAVIFKFKKIVQINFLFEQLKNILIN